MAFFFNRTGTKVSRTYVFLLASPYENTGGSTHEEKTDENNEYPNDEEIERPPPIEVLESVIRQSACGW